MPNKANRVGPIFPRLCFACHSKPSRSLATLCKKREILTMSSLTSDLRLPLEWLIVICIAAAIGIVWFFTNLRKKQVELESNFQRRFAGKNIRLLDKCAVFRAQESHGYSQSQGMGYLVLTDDELYFERTFLRKVLLISTTSITKVGETKRLGGKNPGKPMLKIDFRNNEGNRDSIALTVKELAQWQNEISAVMRKDA